MVPKLSRLMAVTALAGVAACSSKSTAPAASVTDAFHFDSLYNVANAQGNHGDSTRALAIGYIALALGAGSTPTPVTITTGGTATTYQAAVAELVQTNSVGVATDSNFLFVAWNNANADQILLSVQLTSNPANNEGDLVLNDTVVVTPDSGQAYVADSVATASSGKCRTTDVLAADALLQNGATGTTLTLLPCSIARVKASFKWYFTPTGGQSTAYTLSSRNFSAARLLLPPT